jgi:glycosyltransferase involved in cell wall biosynthesis
MRIVIDMQGAQTESRFRGIGRYTLSLAKAMVRCRGDHEILLALNGLFPDTVEPLRAAFDDLLPQENIRVWYAPGPVKECEGGNEGRRGVAELMREAFLVSLQPDVVLVSSLFEGYGDEAVTSIGAFSPRPPTAVILYDLIPLLNPDAYLAPAPAYQASYLNKIRYLKKADLLLTISASAAGEAERSLEFSPARMVNISTACDPVFRRLEASAESRPTLLDRYGIRQPFVLYAGGADSRKNLPRLIQAYARLPVALRRQHQLVLAGKMPPGNVDLLQKAARAVGLDAKELIFTGYVADDELALLYQRCRVFVLPSLHEGFGLPALEAMRCGAPVIGSNTSSIPEVVGRADALFDPLDVEAIWQKLSQALEDETFRRDLAAHGREQAGKFSWEESAQRAMSALVQLHGEAVKNRLPRLGQGEIIQRLVEAVAGVPAEDELPEAECAAIAFHINTNHPETRIGRRVFVDISELVQRNAGTGIQRVTLSVLRELLDSPPRGFSVMPVFATMDKIGYRHASCFVAALTGQAPERGEGPIDYSPGDIFLGLDLQHHVVDVQREYLAKLRRDGVKVFFVVYDLLPVQMPEAFMAGMQAAHETWLRNVTQFDGVVCISRAVAEELRRWMDGGGPRRIRPLAISWFHLGADLEKDLPETPCDMDSASSWATQPNRPTFLSVGTIEPRKAYRQTLEAFEILWDKGLDVNLVIVGRQGWSVEALVEKLRSHPQRGKRLFWLEGIGDDELARVYRSSTCLLAPSHGEGFGLPLIEAAHHGLPIIARDIPVFREVAGAHAHYFEDDRAATTMAGGIEAWLAQYRDDGHPKSDNLNWLTWKQSTAMLLRKILPESDGVQQKEQSAKIDKTTWIVFSQIGEEDVDGNLGMPEYSYYFVLRGFLPVMEELGRVVAVSDPEREVDAIYDECRRRGEDCVFLTFSPPNKAAVGLRCPTLCVFAWEFDRIPDEVWDDDPKNDWRNVLGRHGRAITLSRYSAEAVRRAMGSDFPAAAIPVPVWDDFEGYRRCHEIGRWPMGQQITFKGNVVDSRNYVITADSFALETMTEPFELKPWNGESLKLGFTETDEYSAYLGGFYQPEPWGTWSRIAAPWVWLPYQLSGQVDLKLRLWGYAGNANRNITVALGEDRQEIRIENGVAEADVHFCLNEPQNTLKFSGLDLSPVANAADPRSMGIGIQSMEISGVPSRSHAVRSCYADSPVRRVNLEGAIYTSVFNPGDDRKNWTDMVKGFCLAFGDVSDATLVLKMTHHSLTSFLGRLHFLLQQMWPFKCRIVALHGFLDKSEYEKLIAATSFYVNTSRCEGLCLPLMEFMACGKPAIAPCNTSLSDYVDASSSFIVKSAAEPSIWPHDPRQVFRAVKYRIDFESLVNAYKRSYGMVKNNPEKYEAMAKAASLKMKTYSSRHEIVGQLQEMFKINGENGIASDSAVGANGKKSG